MGLEVMAAIISAACSVADLLSRHREREHDPRPLEQTDIEKPLDVPISHTQFAELTIALYNTYDSAELQVIYNRLAQCRQRFMETLDGQKRQECICDVLHGVAAGNGGSLPGIDDWNETFDQMCRQSSAPPAAGRQTRSYQWPVTPQSSDTDMGLQRANVDESQHRKPERLVMAQH